MTALCSFDWTKIDHVMGPCMRPGGVALTRKALEVCKLPSGCRIADIGCGAGGTLEHLEQAGLYRFAGLDYSKILLEVASSRLSSGHLILGRVEALPFKSGSFDAIFCECVLSAVVDRTIVLNECVRALKDGGFLVISDLFRQGPFGEGEEEAEPQKLLTDRFLTKDGFLCFLKNLGFVILLWEDHKRFLGEFVAQMILNGLSFPELQVCGSSPNDKKKDGQISYFLLVGQKAGVPFLTIDGEGDSK